jgi:hypothetical protein
MPRRRAKGRNGVRTEAISGRIVVRFEAASRRASAPGMNKPDQVEEEPSETASGVKLEPCARGLTTKVSAMSG